MPKVSVVIPTYNLAKYICETVDSVLMQTYKDFEIIIIDDGSKDDTKQVLSKYGSKIKYIYQDNRGVAAARNRGIRESKGEYVALLDADDLWLPEKLTQQVAMAEQNPQVSVFFSDAEVFDHRGLLKPSCRRSHNGQYAPGTFRYKIANAVFNDGSVFKGDFYVDLIMGNLITPGTAFIRKASLEQAGLFDETLTVVDDYDLGLRMARTNIFLYFNSVTARYRLRDDSASGKVNQRGFFYKIYDTKVLDKELRVCRPHHEDLIKKRILESFKSAIWGYFNLGDFKKVRSLCMDSLRYNQFQAKLYLYFLATLLPVGFIRPRTPIGP